jgi:hypothetical protein
MRKKRGRWSVQRSAKTAARPGHSPARAGGRLPGPAGFSMQSPSKHQSRHQVRQARRKKKSIQYLAAARGGHGAIHTPPINLSFVHPSSMNCLPGAPALSLWAPLEGGPASPPSSASTHSGAPALNLLPGQTLVKITGNARTSARLVGLEGVVKRASGLGGWHDVWVRRGGRGERGAGSETLCGAAICCKQARRLHYYSSPSKAQSHGAGGRGAAAPDPPPISDAPPVRPASSAHLVGAGARRGRQAAAQRPARDRAGPRGASGRRSGRRAHAPPPPSPQQHRPRRARRPETTAPRHPPSPPP